MGSSYYTGGPGYSAYQPQWSAGFDGEDDGGAVQAAPQKVWITVHVADDAGVWVNGVLTKSEGTRREFSSSVQSGLRYPYRVTVACFRDGQRVVKTQTVRLVAGERETIDMRF